MDVLPVKFKTKDVELKDEGDEDSEVFIKPKSDVMRTRTKGMGKALEGPHDSHPPKNYY
jgi:hypothetical protein